MSRTLALLSALLLAPVAAADDATPAPEAAPATDSDATPVEVKRQRAPKFPDSAAAAFLARHPEGAICEIQVTVGSDGRARQVEFVDCPAPFQDTSAAALEAWRWKVTSPASDTPILFDLTFTFRQHAG